MKARQQRWIAGLAGLIGIALFGPPGIPLASAKSLYKYQNASGAWVFTDRPPAADTPAEVRPLPVQELPTKISIRNRGAPDAPILAVVNDYYGPLEVEISAETLENMRADPALPVRVVAPARTEASAVMFKPTGPRWRYAYQIRAVLGDPAAVHQPDQPYAPPFASGQRFGISQAFNGAFSHQHPQSRYAVDIALPLGTPVRAARAGVVMEIAADFLDGGTDPKYQSRANAVRILHQDGTMAVYAHLQADSVRVTPGQRVERSAWLANSGNTGFSTGPHLHFVIQRNAGMELVSVPFEFARQDGHGITPVEGMLLTAP
ncbi:M23 family metallopeptidase [Candidatus Contendibacter odensensis]|uniref:Peptidase M23 n=1 Tax=Candidatus Contendobacter odensis Run_B_J11 TaxID=1400861 RepID=A0A7U7J661_9GAMM|nr:M23 family metallopeptidase [Candidatus Contendobacter odensis]CDH47730.1 putative Peptidase M23 [Candidatus Contendobacter odensis Run_B_J11]